MIATLCVEKDLNSIVSLYPFFSEGSQHTVILEKVLVWDGGCDAQITVLMGDAEITFFDTSYLINRAWYEAGRTYDFIFTGIAYVARPPEVMEFTVNHGPEMLAFLRRIAEERGEQPASEDEQTYNMAGMAMLLPVEGWDQDEYGFRGLVKSVKQVHDVLGQNSWVVRATVLRPADLEDKLGFPFGAKCVTTRTVSPLKKGEAVEVLKMAPEDACMNDMVVLTRFAGRTLGVPLSQLDVLKGDEQTREAVADWHYWKRMGNEF